MTGLETCIECPVRQGESDYSPFMGIERISLELPARSSAADAVDRAKQALRVRGIREWSKLELQSRLTSESPGISRFMFTYWAAT